MSDWDSGRRSDGQFDTPRPSWPDGTTYSYPLPFPLPQAVDDDEPWFPDLPPPPGGGRHRADGPPPGGDWDDGPPPDGDWDDGPGDDRDDGARDQFDATMPQPAVSQQPPLQQPLPPPRRSYYPWPPAPYPRDLKEAAGDSGDWADAGGGRPRGRRRGLILGGIAAGAAAAGAAGVLLTGNHSTAHGRGLAAPSTTASAAPAKGVPSAAASMAVRMSAKPSASQTSQSPQAQAPLTLAQAQAVLGNYTTVNNNANAQRSDTLLTTIETGSSFAIDAGLYVQQQAEQAAPFPAFGPAQATYYIPRDQPADGPRWFVVQVANAFAANPQKVTSTEYLLFTQSAPGAAWVDTLEPFLLSGASAPQIAVGADGLATAVSPASGSVTVAPGTLPAVTAASLDGTGGGGAAVADPGNLADRSDQRTWQGKVTGGTVVDTHAAAAGANGQEFALRTADGGALVFYTDAAAVTVAASPGSTLNLTIPGVYSPAQALSVVKVRYLEQFAAYDPPAGGGAPRVVADYSGITGKG
jgi:hypothetical protein